MTTCSSFLAAGLAVCAATVPANAQQPPGTPPPAPSSAPAPAPPALIVSVPTGVLVPNSPVAPRCYFGPGYPYPTYGSNPTYPPIPGTVGYYPNVGNTQIVVQLGFINNLAIGPNSSASQGHNTAAVSGTVTATVQSAEALKQMLDRIEAASKTDQANFERLLRVLAEIRDRPPPVSPTIQPIKEPSPTPAAPPGGAPPK